MAGKSKGEVMLAPGIPRNVDIRKKRRLIYPKYQASFLFLCYTSSEKLFMDLL